jgi:hypothetical protein
MHVDFCSPCLQAAAVKARIAAGQCGCNCQPIKQRGKLSRAARPSTVERLAAARGGHRGCPLAQARLRLQCSAGQRSLRKLLHA